MESMAKIVNSTPQAAIKVPTTTYKLKQMVNPDFNVVYNIKCAKCGDYIETKSKEAECVKCSQRSRTANSSYFISLPIEPQIKKSIMDHFSEVISYHSNMMQKNENVIRDIHDSEQYMKVAKLYPDAIVVSLVINTDGAQVFNSSRKSSLWPIQMYQNHLNPSIRYLTDNILVAALFCGETPKMNELFLPVLKELKRIGESGGIWIEREQKKYHFIPLITHCVCDMPAKIKVQDINQFNGYNSCGFCHHPGVLIKKNPKHNGYVRYVRRDVSLRNHEEFIKAYRAKKFTSDNGIKGISCLVAAKHFDLVVGFGIDYMHCILLGVLKRLFELWFGSVKYLSKYNQNALNSRITRIKPILEISRKPGSVFDFAKYKANEYRTLLLYYLPCCLDGLLERKYVNHFQLLSSAIYVLLKENITRQEIKTADEKLNKFADQFELLYGIDNVTMNLHLVRHIGLAVNNLGPLWAQSAFGFESNNGVLTRSITAKRNILQQIAFKYDSKSKLKSVNSSTAMNTGNQIGGKQKSNFREHEKNLLNSHGIRTEEISHIYTRATFHYTKYTCKRCKPISTVDFFVILRDGTIGAVHFYVWYNSKILGILEKFKIISGIDHISEIDSLNEHIIFYADEIDRKLMCMTVNNKNFVCTIPNKYEKS